jgi:hypothetical protein
MGYGYVKGEPRERPEMLDEMLEIAKKLSGNIIFVRIDLYLIGSEIYFGEMTFLPENALEQFFPDKYDYEWGSLIQLKQF